MLNEDALGKGEEFERSLCSLVLLKYEQKARWGAGY